MDISVAWLNRYLDPGRVTADEADRLLTHAGFPIESAQTLPSGDTRLDVEVTSNRGDCLSHVGLAREIAASTTGDHARRLLVPRGDSRGAEPARTGDLRAHIALENTTPALCPLFTVQLIRGVKVGPSPAWLVDLLEAAGQRSINSVVDVTNFITLELGHPCHVFDLTKLAGGRLVVRHAREKEALTTLDGKRHTLSARDLVVADAERAQSLAGVMGGADSEVDASTVDVVLEMATWDPVTVREQGRRHGIRTDAGYRFERIVPAAEIEAAARRAAALIVEVAGGSLMGGGDASDGILRAGAPVPGPTVVTLRPQRCRAILGIEVGDGEMREILQRLEIRAEGDGPMRCTIPAFRTDLVREIDLIEEIARVKGYGAIPVQDTMPVRVTHPQESERAVREIDRALTGLGFYETVTFSFCTPAEGERFVPAGVRTVAVDDERRGEEPTLRPSVLPGLLRCRQANRTAGVQPAGGVRLFERSAVFGQDERGASRERRVLTLLMDVVSTGRRQEHADAQRTVRELAGALGAVVRAVGGSHASVELEPIGAGEPIAACWDGSARARVVVRRDDLRLEVGVAGLIAAGESARYDLEGRVAAAEVEERALAGLFPPTSRVEPMPAFPAIERDLSLIVDEARTWAQVREVARGALAGVARLEGVRFIGVYRGEQVGAGKKSVTLRLVFREGSRTLRHEEVDPQVEAVVAAAREALGATLRS